MIYFDFYLSDKFVAIHHDFIMQVLLKSNDDSCFKVIFLWLHLITQTFWHLQIPLMWHLSSINKQLQVVALNVWLGPVLSSLLTKT